MGCPDDLLYTKDHEWVRVEGDKAVIGITEFAQAELGDLVFVDLPAVGKEVKIKDSMCVVESTKAASDVYAPISGKVAEINSNLPANPEKINHEPYTEGWLVKLENINKDEIKTLLSAQQYRELIGE